MLLWHGIISVYKSVLIYDIIFCCTFGRCIPLWFDIDGNPSMVILFYWRSSVDGYFLLLTVICGWLFSAYESTCYNIGRDHEHLDGRAADWGLLPDPEDERDDVPHLQARGASEEPGGVRQHGLPRTAHVRVCAGGSLGGCVADLSFVDLFSDPTFQKIHDLFLSVADPGSGAFLTPGKKIRILIRDPDPGWTTRIIFPSA